MRKIALALSLLLSISLWSQEKIIFDTDFGGDADDLGALAIMNNLVNDKKCEVLAVMSQNVDVDAIAAIDGVNRYYGNEDIPLAIRDSVYYVNVKGYCTAVKNGLTYKRINDDVPLCLDLYREILSKAEDKSIVLVTVGPLDNIYNLISTEEGLDLVKRKIKRFTIMGGRYPECESEWNFWGNKPGVSRTVLAKLSGFVPITIVGAEIGMAIKIGDEFNDYPGNNPLYPGFLYFSANADWMNVNYKGRILDNPCYDQITLLHGIFGDEYYAWDIVDGWRCEVEDNSATKWVEDSNSPHKFMKLAADTLGFRQEILELMVRGLKRVDNKVDIQRLGAANSIIKLAQEDGPSLLILPIQENAPDARFRVIENNVNVRELNIRLAVDRIDYYVPFNIAEFKGDITLLIQNCAYDAVCWDKIERSDSFDRSNREKYRPAYHFTPAYGWMNDPNGMFYKDGVYHLYYQHNPYFSTWSNMHWGHATTTNFIDWEHQPVAIAPNGLGAIYSGSAIVDKNNCSGFGKDAIIAFYTSAGVRETQSVAYSLDGGMSFTPYENNPVLTSEIRDFRDPKVVWNEETQKWIMVLAVKDRVEFYSSTNLLDWTFESEFGEEYGWHGGIWECPDLLEMPIGDKGDTRWVLICNINPGGLYGGSSTQYFIGDFDGNKFSCEDNPEEVKWMDYGKDHYATVSWSNTPDSRNTVIAWMSNWQYANSVPTKQYRSATSLPRDLGLYEFEGEHYVSVAPAKEVEEMITPSATSYKVGTVNGKKEVQQFDLENNGRYEVELEIKNRSAEIVGIELSNEAGEFVRIYYDIAKQEVVMDRNNSGKVDFNKHFPAITRAPINSDSKTMGMRIFVDNSSIELFDSASRWVMTNIVFPSQPYTKMTLYSEGGSYKVTQIERTILFTT